MTHFKRQNEEARITENSIKDMTSHNPRRTKQRHPTETTQNRQELQCSNWAKTAIYPILKIDKMAKASKGTLLKT